MSLVGNTPMIKINYKYENEEKYVYAKLEYYNLTGSIKDRIAYYIIENAIKRNELKKDMPIIEATSGNTGIALASIGARLKHPVYIFMPDWVSMERIKIMQMYGAKVFLVSKEDGGFVECLSRASRMAKETNGFLVDQFSNKDNFKAHYETTGKEIIEDIKEEIGAFVSGVGTGGTLMGCGLRIKDKYKNSKIIAIEPEKMPLISNGEIKGDHKIEGIGDEFVPELLHKDTIDGIYLIDDDDAINMSRKLAKELGLGVGISSGANLIGAILQERTNTNRVVTVFPDDNKKYLSTDLSKQNNDNPNYISNKITLLNFKLVNN